MRQNARWRWALPLTLLLTLAEGSTAVLAADALENPSLISTTFPTQGEVSLYDTSTANVLWLFASWNSSQRIFGLRDQLTDAYEIEAVVPNDSPTQCFPGDYTSNWDSNFPAAYQDTALEDDEDQAFSRGGGSAVSRNLSVGVSYYFIADLGPVCPGREVVPVKVKSQESVLDASRPGACIFGYQFCVFAKEGSPRDIVPYRSGLFTPLQFHQYAYNRLINDSFESLGNWVFNPVGGNGSAGIATGTAFEGDRFARFSCATASICYIEQNVPFLTRSTDLFTAEVAMRCPSSNPAPCPMALELWGVGGTGSEAVRGSYVLPNDNRWRVLQGLRGTGYGPRTNLLFRVTSTAAGQTLDADFATLHFSDTFNDDGEP